MNFQSLIDDPASHNDYQRLVELCSSYGLNEQQTNQIISDFKNGSFAQPDQSVDDSFQQSLRNLESHSHQYTDRQENEEYSFKHQKVRNTRTVEQNDSLDQGAEGNCLESHGPMGGNDELIQNFINERRDFQQNLYRKMEQENEALKQRLREKDEKIEMLITMKAQDSDIIEGLKNSIVTLTTLLQQKEQANKLITERYQKLKYDCQSSTQKSSKVHLQSLNSLQERKSLTKDYCLTEVDNNRLVKKPSHKNIKETYAEQPQAMTRNSLKNNSRFIENRENIPMARNEPTKRSGIDISKYKGMIEKLRSSHQFR